MRWMKSLLMLLCLIAFAHSLVGQSTKLDSSENVRIQVDHSDIAHLIKTDSGDVQVLVGHVELRHDSVYLYCDSAFIVDNRVDAVGHVIIQDRDSVSAFGRFLHYNGYTRIANLRDSVVLINNERKLFSPDLTYNLNTKDATYTNGGVLFDGDLQMISHQGIYNSDRQKAIFKDSVSIVHKDFELKSDSIEYDYSTKTVFFLGKTLIYQDRANIYCEDGYYDMNAGKAMFTQKAQYVGDERTAIADTILYDRSGAIVTLIGQAAIKEIDKYATADTIIYFENSQKSDLIGNAYFEDGESVIESLRILYDGLSNSINASGKTIVQDGSQYLESDELLYDDNTGMGLAVGSVIWRDTSQGTTIYSDRAEYNNTNEYVKAYGVKRPLLIKKMDTDSLYLSADTLLSFKIIQYDTLFYKPVDIIDSSSIEAFSKRSRDSTAVLYKRKKAETFLQVDTIFDRLSKRPSKDTLTMRPVHSNVSVPRDSILSIQKDTVRQILAFHDVRIFKKDLQAVSDSLSYDSNDSIFKFYGNPFIWSDTTQLSGDTIYVHMKNNQVDAAQLKRNGFIISSQDLQFFDQIKGRDVWSYYKDGKLDYVQVKGNAESYYYVLDKSDAYIGLNKSICSEIIVHFQDHNNIDHINFLKTPNFNFLPMKDVLRSSPKLEGFSWNLSRRPKSIIDLTAGLSITEEKVKREVNKKEVKRNFKE